MYLFDFYKTNFTQNFLEVFLSVIFFEITALSTKNGDLTSENAKLSDTIDDVKSQFGALKKVLGALDNASVPQALVDGNIAKPNPGFGMGAVILLAFVGVGYAFKHMNSRVHFQYCLKHIQKVVLKSTFFGSQFLLFQCFSILCF